MTNTSLVSSGPKSTWLMRTCQVITVLSMMATVLGAIAWMVQINDIEPVLFAAVPASLILQAGLFVVFGEVVRTRESR